MYKLIIVDDETGIHDLLKDSIEIMIGGYEVTGCFANGSEAISYIEENPVDIVLTDIKMPVMDGLELCEYLYNHHPKIKVIVLSGYGEFEYAKKAIEFNVTDYLLKAVDFNELEESLKKISGMLDAERADDNEALLESFCTELIVGVLEPGEIRERYYGLDLPYNIEDIRLSIYRMEFENYTEIMENSWRYESENFQDAVLGVIQSVVKEVNGGIVAAIVSDREYMIVGVLGDSELKGFEDEVTSSIVDIMKLRTSCFKILDGAGIFDISTNNHVLDSEEIYKIMISCIKMLSVDKAKLMIERLMHLNESERVDIDDRFDVVRTNDVSGAYENIREKLDDETIIANAKAYIDQNFDKDISRKDIADTVFFNAAYFSRYFKQITGEALGDYILKIRMENAIKLLGDGVKIQDISLRSGFKNVRHFQRTFKTYTGYSPSDYRKSVLKKDF